MNVASTALPGVLIIEPRIFGDQRGRFLESYNAARYADAGVTDRFVQDNVSVSRRGVLRGLHVQHPHTQAKLVQVLAGEVFDVIVDVRVGSPHFGKWMSVELSSATMRQVYIPAGYAHGFVATSDEAVLAYKCTDFYHPEAELSVAWNDPTLAIAWPLTEVELSAKDRAARPLAQIGPELLPRYAP